MKIQIPVSSKSSRTDGRWSPEKDIPGCCGEARRKALRAELIMQSLITGQLMIQLDFYSKSNCLLCSTEIDKEYKDYIRDSNLQVHQRTAGPGPGDLDLRR